jgi:hypothetical protein
MDTSGVWPSLDTDFLRSLSATSSSCRSKRMEGTDLGKRHRRPAGHVSSHSDLRRTVCAHRLIAIMAIKKEAEFWAGSRRRRFYLEDAYI